MLNYVTSPTIFLFLRVKDAHIPNRKYQVPVTSWCRMDIVLCAHSTYVYGGSLRSSVYTSFGNFSFAKTR